MKKLLLFMIFSVSLSSAQIDTSKWFVVNGNHNGDGCLSSANATETGGFGILTMLNAGPYTCGSTFEYSGATILSDPFTFATGYAIYARVRFGTPTSQLASALWAWGGSPTSSGFPPTCLSSIAAGGVLMASCTTTSVLSYELDIGELDGTGAIFQNLFTWSNGTATQVCAGTANTGTPWAEYHVYGVRIFPNQLIFTIDGAVTSTCNFTLPSDVAMMLLMDTEVRFVSPSYPTNMSVDWVRSYNTPYAVPNGGETPVFDDEFNAGVVVTPINHAIQGQAIQGGAIQ